MRCTNDPVEKVLIISIQAMTFPFLYLTVKGQVLRKFIIYHFGKYTWSCDTALDSRLRRFSMFDLCFLGYLVFAHLTFVRMFNMLDFLHSRRNELCLFTYEGTAEFDHFFWQQLQIVLSG